MAKHGKKYQAALEKVEADKFYTPMEAAKLAKEISTANFDESVEAHFRLNVDTRQADRPRRRLCRGRQGQGGRGGRC